MSTRSAKGVSIAESAAALSLVIPIIITIVFAILEVSQAYLIKSSLSQAAREAARNLAIAYGEDPSVAGSRSVQDASVFDHVRIPQIVADSRQFSNPVWRTNANPPAVTVTVTYTGSQYGLPPFPNPDPIHLGQNFPISAQATYRLE